MFSTSFYLFSANNPVCSGLEQGHWNLAECLRWRRTAERCSSVKEDLCLDLLNFITEYVFNINRWIQRGPESSAHASSGVESSPLWGRSKSPAVRLTWSALPEVGQTAGQWAPSEHRLVHCPHCSWREKKPCACLKLSMECFKLAWVLVEVIGWSCGFL